jgi:hypothetical protein
MNRRPLGVALLLTVVASSVAALGVTGAPGVPVGRADGGQVRVVPAVPGAGGAVCVDAAGSIDPVSRVLLAAPPHRDPDGPASDASGAVAARGTVLVLGRDEAPGRIAVGPVAPGGLETVPAAVGVEGWTWTGWADHPLVAWQEWRTDGAPGQPRGIIAALCLPSDASEWTVLGLRTDGGNEALLRIVNPHPADATFAVSLITSAGQVEPIALRNVSVAAGSHTVVRLNDHLPEESGITAVVTVGAGRIVVGGLQRAAAGLGDVEGVTAVPALTSPATTWTLPWLPSGPGFASVVWIRNPDARAVTVQVTAHTPQGSALPELLDSVEVAAGAVVAIDAADLAPAGRRVLGVTFSSDTTPVHVAAAVRFLADGSDGPGEGGEADSSGGTGISRFVASDAPDSEWLVAGGTAPGRRTALHIVNLDEAEARPVVTLTMREDRPEADIPEAPVAAASGSITIDRGHGVGEPVTQVLQPGAIPPGAVMRVELPLVGAGSWSAVVTGGAALVVARTTFGSEVLEPVVMAALPSRLWRVPTVGLVGRPLDGWVARIGAAG